MNDHYPVITISLMITIGIVSLMGFTNYSIINQYKHYPYYEWREKSYYRWISCTFLHGNYMHLFLNLFVLWQFGSLIEQIYMVKFGFWQGALVYLALYFALAVLSSIPTFFKHRENSDYASIGASGVFFSFLFCTSLLQCYLFSFSCLCLLGSLHYCTLVFPGTHLQSVRMALITKPTFMELFLE